MAIKLEIGLACNPSYFQLELRSGVRATDHAVFNAHETVSPVSSSLGSVTPTQ